MSRDIKKVAKSTFDRLSSQSSSRLSFNTQFRVPLPSAAAASNSGSNDCSGLKIAGSSTGQSPFITSARNLLNDDESKLFIEIDDEEFAALTQQVATPDADQCNNRATTDFPENDLNMLVDMALLDADMFTSPIAVPKPISTINKRRSTDLSSETCKKRLLDQLNIHESTETGASSSSPIWPCETEIFETQFFEQIDRAAAASFNTVDKLALTDATTSETCSKSTLPADNFTNLSQFFKNTQFEMPAPPKKHLPTLRRTVQPRDSQIRIEKKDFQPVKQDIPKRKLPPSTQAYNLTQFFNDDVDDENSNLSDGTSTLSSFPQSSQIFLEAVREVLPETQNSPNKEDEFQTVYKSATTAAEYIEIQRDMNDANENNVNEDNCVDPELSQAYKSTQYRHELEKVFKNYENTLYAGLDELIDADGPPIPEDGINPNREETVASNGVPESVAEAEDVDWEATFDVTPVKKKSTPAPLITPTVLIQQRLSHRKSLVSSTTPPAVSRTSSFDNPAPGIFVPVGPFFGLPAMVKTLIRDYKGITNLYDWQKECLSLPAIDRRNNLIYALPTSGGKTLVSEIIILREIICRRKNCLFILPYVSIVQEKLWALSPFAVQLNFLLEEYAAGKGSLPPRQRRKRSIYIATIEKGLALLDSLIETDRANEIGLIVVDELHIIGEPGRGATLENLLTKALYIKAGIQIIGMSATIGNLNEIAKFLDADVYTRDFRPVELKEYIKCGSDILQIKPNDGKTSFEAGDAFEFVRTVDFKYRDEGKRQDPDHLAGLVSEVIPENACLIFCSSKKGCENAALLLTKMLPSKYLEHKSVQRTELAKFLTSHVGPLCSVLARTIPYGIAYHHSGLTSDERRHLEDAFRQNILCVICCTSTLAAGVNLPAKRVILRSPYIGRDFITLSRYKQMIGRAGRAGMCGDVGESILICPARDNVRVGQLLFSPMDEAASSMHADDCRGLRALVLSAVGLKMATCQTDLHRLIGSSLMTVQASRLDVNPVKLTDDIIHNLFKLKALSVDESSGSPALNTTLSTQIIPITQGSEAGGSTGKKIKNVRLKPSTQLCVSKLGKAAFKSGFDLAKAQQIYRDLEQAQQGLVLSCYLHLLYVVTPYEPADINLQPDMTIYFAQYQKLDQDERQVAKILGITESVAIKIASGKQFKTDLARTGNRFFLTLVMNDLWKQRSVHEIAETFKIDRGVVQSFITATTSYANGVLKFCEELPEFWAFRELFGVLTKRLSYCCTAELVPLMELPCVKLARAKQLHSAGFRNVESIAKASVSDLVDVSEYLTQRVAKQLISAAKVLLLERVETKREEMQECLDALEGKK